MLGLAWAKWVALHLLRQPLTWVWLAFSAAAWPVVTTLAPLGLIGGSSLETGLFYEVAFIGLVLGTLLGAGRMDQAERFAGGFLGGAGPLGRLALELWTLSIASALLVGPAVVLPLVVRGSDPGRFLAHVALAHLHLCGLVLVLARLGLGALPRAVALLLVVWVLPAVVDPGTFAARFLETSLSTARILAPGPESVLGGPVWKERLAPIIGLVGAAFLLRPGTLLHALRNPR